MEEVIKGEDYKKKTFGTEWRSDKKTKQCHKYHM